MIDFSSKVREERRLATYHYHSDWEQDPVPDLRVEIQRNSVTETISAQIATSKAGRELRVRTYVELDMLAVRVQLDATRRRLIGRTRHSRLRPPDRAHANHLHRA